MLPILYSVMLPSIYFVTAHPNPANHFVEYVQAYEKKGISCKVIAGTNVSEKFASVKSEVVVIDPSSLGAEELLSQLKFDITSQIIVITDIANEHWVALHQKLSETHPSITRAVYYDNPEPYVPGGYSELAAKVINAAQIVLFANSSLVQKGIESSKGAPIDLSQKSTIGIGYYPKTDANKILEIREDKAKVAAIRSSLLKNHAIVDTDQRVFVYTGGANDEYYKKAFPHFIRLVTDLSKASNSPLENTIFILQQHPRAKTEGDRDAKVVRECFSLPNVTEGFQFIVSDLPTNESLAIADGVLYYQTSMAAQFVFAKIPSVIQVGHETYPDLLVRAGFPSVTDTTQLSKVLSSLRVDADIQLLEKELGIDKHWQENLLKIVSLPIFSH